MIPSKATDVGKLRPVQTVAVSREDNVYRIQTDTGDYGLGGSVEEAFINLEETTPAVIYLDTADFLLVKQLTVADAAQLQNYLTETTAVFAYTGEPDLELASDYLAVHGGGIPLKEWGSGTQLRHLFTDGKRLVRK